MPAQRTGRAVALVLGTTLALAGCGGGGGEHSLQEVRSYAAQDGAAIAGDARHAMRSLTTMHVAGRIDEGSNAIVLDLSVSKSGDCVGTIGVDDGRVQLRSVGGKAWFRADDAFWRLEAGQEADRIAGIVAGRWVVLGGQLEQLRSFCRIDRLTGQMLAHDSRVRTLGPAMVGTTPTVRLAVAHAGVTSTAYVVASSPHYVVRIQRTAASGADAGEVDFSAFDEKFTVSPPAAHRIFDLRQLHR